MISDPWADFCEVFAPELRAANTWTPEQMDAMADEYQRDQIASANSAMPDNEPAEDLG